MENRCIIVSGGVFGPAPERRPGDFIIACDRGYAYCERLGLTPPSPSATPRLSMWPGSPARRTFSSPPQAF